MVKTYSSSLLVRFALHVLNTYPRKIWRNDTKKLVNELEVDCLVIPDEHQTEEEGEPLVYGGFGSINQLTCEEMEEPKKNPIGFIWPDDASKRRRKSTRMDMCFVPSARSNSNTRNS